MEFKVGDKVIRDVKKYGLFGRSAMVVQLDKFGNKTLIFGQGERTRALILHLISQIQKEVKDVSKVEETESYKILDNLLNMLFVQIELSSGEWCGEYAQYISKFIEKKYNKVKAPKVTDKESEKALQDAVLLEKVTQKVSKK